MAAAAAAVRRSRNMPQPPAKHAVEELMALSTEALEAQDVLAFEIRSCHVDLGEDLNEIGGKSLKLKFRMHDVTYLKATGHRVSLPHCKSQHIAFDSLGSAIYEGGEDLRFDLCVSHLFQTCSQTIASGQVSLKHVLGSLEDGQSSCFDIELRDLASSCKVLANLNVSVGVRLTTLKAAGGMSVLKSIPAPSTSERYAAFAFAENSSSCRSYSHQAEMAQQRLQHAVKAATSYMKGQQQVQISKDPRNRKITMNYNYERRNSLTGARNQSKAKQVDLVDDVSTASGSTASAST